MKGTGRILIYVSKEGLKYATQLRNLERPQLAELIVAMEILIDELKDKFKITREEVKRDEFEK
jgi:hypothetical protein